MRVLLAVLTLSLAGCAGAPPAPDWQANAHGALKDFTAAYLEGDTRLAELDLARARAEIARTGRADLLARAELVRCAARVASLEFDDCPAFRALAEDAGAEEQAYAAFLAGRWPGLDPARVPAQYRPLVVAGAGGEAGALKAIEDPMSRLVATAILFRNARLAPAGIAAAVETASARGWRRPLLAWLGVQAKRAEDAGDRDAAARIRRRIDLVANAAPAKP